MQRNAAPTVGGPEIGKGEKWGAAFRLIPRDLLLVCEAINCRIGAWTVDCVDPPALGNDILAIRRNRASVILINFDIFRRRFLNMAHIREGVPTNNMAAYASYGDDLLGLVPVDLADGTVIAHERGYALPSGRLPYLKRSTTARSIANATRGDVLGSVRTQTLSWLRGHISGMLVLSGIMERGTLANELSLL